VIAISGGIYVRYDNGVFTRIHPSGPRSLPRTSGKFIVADIDGNSVGDLVVDFGPPTASPPAGTISGVWAFVNNTFWGRLSADTTAAMAAGDMNGNGKDELVVSVPAKGLYIRYDTGVWKRIQTAVPTHMILTDVDGIGREDLVVDFGAGGLWVFYDNINWGKIYAGSIQDIAAGRLNE
jgi:hypothetical protein